METMCRQIESKGMQIEITCPYSIQSCEQASRTSKHSIRSPRLSLRGSAGSAEKGWIRSLGRKVCSLLRGSRPSMGSGLRQASSSTPGTQHPYAVHRGPVRSRLAGPVAPPPPGLATRAPPFPIMRRPARFGRPPITPCIDNEKPKLRIECFERGKLARGKRYGGIVKIEIGCARQFNQNCHLHAASPRPSRRRRYSIRELVLVVVAAVVFTMSESQEVN